MQNIFIDVLPPWVETGLQPAFYDLESGTVLQQTARMYAKVRELTEAFNTFSTNVTNEVNHFEEVVDTRVTNFENSVNETVADYIDRFNTLYNYVHDYFDNLDVQEEINNKIDDMVESGEFDTLLANYLVISGGNAKQLGCAGDGVTDDTTAIQTAINNISTLGVNKLVFPSGEYVISDTISLPSNFELVGMEGSVLKYVGAGETGSIISITGTDADTYVSNVKITNVNIDGTAQTYKGGAENDDPDKTNTDPQYKGLTCVEISFAKDIEVRGCTFTDVYGDGIVLRNVACATIKDNKLFDVSSGNIDANDDHGDGIVAFRSYDIDIEGNTVINHRVYIAGRASAIGKPCGRSGLEFEYSINENAPSDNPDDPEYNAPDYSDIPLVTEGDKQYRYGVGLRIKNNYVYGYTKGVHIETRVKTIIEGNTIVYNHVCIMCSTSNQSIITCNYIDTFGVGEAPQQGYDNYYGCIAISQWGVTSKRYGFIITNNNLNGDGKGVSVGCGHVSIMGNCFNTAYGVYTVLQDLSNISVVMNTFNNTDVSDFNTFVRLYHVKSSELCYNSFYSTTETTLTVNGSDLKIKNNDMVNTGINSEYGGSNYDISYNHITGDSFTGHIIAIYNLHNSIVCGNSYEVEDFNTASKYPLRFSGTTTKSTISNNSFTITSTLNPIELIKAEECFDVTFESNKMLTDNANVRLISTGNNRSCRIIDNSVVNDGATFLRINGSAKGMTIVESNKGVLSASGLLPNTDLYTQIGEYCQQSQKLYKYNITGASTSLGYVCVSAGYWAQDTWSSQSYAVGKVLKTSGSKVYKCTVAGAGASTVEPSHSSGSQAETDGYTWEYIGVLAEFKALSL